MAEAEQQPCAEILWKVENFTYCWQEKNERLTSSKFFVEGLGKTSWHLSLFPRGDYTEDFELYLERAENDEGNKTAHVKFEMAVLANGNLPFTIVGPTDHSFSKGSDWGWSSVISRSVIINSAEELYPMNVLTVRCKMWSVDTEQPSFSNVIDLRTIIPVTQSSFKWNIDLAAAEGSNQEKTISFPLLFGSKDFLHVKLSYVCQNLDCRLLKLFFSGCLLKKYSFKCDIQTMQAEEDFFLTVRTINDLPYESSCSTLFTQNQLIENSEKYLAGLILPLKCEFSIISHEVKDYNTQYIESEQSSKWFPRKMANYEDMFLKKSSSTKSDREDSSSVLKTDILRMYQDTLNSDFNLQVEDQIFPVHSCILSARSAVLQRMFDTEMREKQEKILKIEDLDRNTVKKMLDYVYSDSPGELDFDSVVKLYYAGDKYELFGLKKMCSEYMMQNITICNLYEILMIADRHNDEDLKSLAVQFIFENEKVVVLSDEFKTFSKSNPQLSVELMQCLLELKLAN